LKQNLIEEALKPQDSIEYCRWLFPHMQRRFGAWADQIEIKISGGKKISFDQG
jgi:hypothetical protein